MDNTQQLVQAQQQQQEQLQNLVSLLGGTNGQSSIFGEFQSMLQLVLIVGGLMAIVFLLFFVLHFMHKWRVESAILRIDKNLEKLVAVQVPVVNEDEKHNSSDKEK